MIKFLVCVRGTVTVCVSMSFSVYVSVFEWQISSLTYGGGLITYVKEDICLCLYVLQFVCFCVRVENVFFNVCDEAATICFGIT